MDYRLPSRYIFQHWDGSHESSLDTDALLDAISDDIMEHGDLDLALQKAFRWGFQGQHGQGAQGMRDVLQHLREQRQQLMDKYDLGSLFSEAKEMLDDILERESATIEERQQQLDGLEDAEFAEQMGEFLSRKRETVDQTIDMPFQDRMHALGDYDFVDQQAQKDFDALRDQLQQQIRDSMFNSLMNSAPSDPESGERIKDFLSDINEALEADARGEPVDLDRINNKWAQELGGRVGSVADLQERLQSRADLNQRLLDMLSPEQRDELEQLMMQAAQETGLSEELDRLRDNLGPMFPSPQPQPPQPGQGEELSLSVAMELMKQLNDMDSMINDLQSMQELEELQGLDKDMLDRLLNEEDRAWLDEWATLEQQLEDEGLVTRNRNGMELTPRAVRKIGERALQDIYSSLDKLKTGEHEIPDPGALGELADTTAPWQFGDAFQLNLARTVLNGVMQRGPGTPVQLGPDDFEVYDHEARTSTATVLLVDMSRSMLHNGCWDAAKRSAIALDTLIRSKYPRDAFELVGFSATAERLKVTDLPTLEWNEYTFGTNLQHALQLSRELLAPHRASNRQVIVITDGEPTAHLDQGEIRFDYPPTPETYEATLKEVVRCTREGITINTFLLEHTPHMRRFIEDLMRVNRGKVMNASPTRLGSYVLTDFLRQRTEDRMAF